MRPAPWAHFRLHPLLARSSSSLQTPCRFPLHLHAFPSSSSCASSPPPLPASFLSFAPFLKTPSSTGKIALAPLSPPIITTGMASSSASSWRCSRCTYLNPTTQKSFCEVCLSPSISSPPRGWSCKACTFANALASSACEVCSTEAFSRSLGLDSVDVADGANDLGASVGSAFLPLQRCKRQSHSEDEAVTGDDGDEIVPKELEQHNG